MANTTISTMDEYCGSKFWDLDLSWNTTDPDLTKCFEKTVLVWIPCLFLWTFSTLEVYYIATSKRRDIPWNWKNFSKLFFTSALIVLCVIDLITVQKKTNDVEVYSVDIYTPIMKIITFGLSGVLLYFNKKYGIQTSGLQFLFWFLLAIFGIPQLRTEIRGTQLEPGVDNSYFYYSYVVYFALVLTLIVLNCFADHAPKSTEHPKLKKPCPEEGSSFISRLFFFWFEPLVWKGFRHPLVDDDLWDLTADNASREIVPIFDKHWQKTLQKRYNSSTNQGTTRVSFKPDVVHVDFSKKDGKKPASVLPALVKSFGSTFLFGSSLKLVQDLLTFVSPQILSWLINFIKAGEEQWKGISYAALLFIVASVQTLILSQYFNRMFLVGIRIRTVLVSAIYRKALRISNSSRKESTVGEIVNLMSVDAQKFVDLTAYLNMIWSAPLQIILALYFLWEILGPSVLAGLAVMIILIPVNGFIANKVKVLQVKQMKNKDERVKLMNEVLSGIKVLKLYAWEPSFEAQILKIRTKEIKVLKQAAYMNAGTSFIWSCAPFLVCVMTFAIYVLSDSNNILTPAKAFVSLTLFAIMSMPLSLLPMVLVYTVEVSLVSFATYVMVDDKNILDAQTAFVSISLFNILRFPLSMLPMMISNMVQAAVSIQRINKFMNSEELDPNNVSHEEEADPLLIENGTFTWGDDPILKNINIRLKNKSLSAVVGTVGSGKSSLISAFLGEMDKKSGRVNTVGSIAYVAQQAWIQNATLRDNITFGKAYDKKIYENVINACALRPDFDMLPAGDQTEIGEKGINLSGGQKQRVSLARAVYADAEVYFLDDPLSAVDSHVGKHIFEHVIGPKGLLHNKTRMLVTHGVTFLPQVDQIIVLKDGEVTESGTYQQLLDKKGAFADFLVQHITENIEEEEDLEELTNQLGTIDIEIARKIQRNRSRVSESLSEAGSEKANGSLKRQQSSDSDRMVRHRSSSAGEKKGSISGARTGEKLIEVEKAETGRVKFAVYKHYIMSIGTFLTLTTIFLNMVFQGFSVGSNFWLSVWANDAHMVDANGTANHGKRDLYLGVYGALGIGQAVSVCLSALALYIGSLNGASALHNLLVSNILRVPSTTFFDVTPVGRILNRFSKDVDTLDNVLPMTIRGWITCLFSMPAMGSSHMMSCAEMNEFRLTIEHTCILYHGSQLFYLVLPRHLRCRIHSRLDSISANHNVSVSDGEITESVLLADIEFKREWILHLRCRESSYKNFIFHFDVQLDFYKSYAIAASLAYLVLQVGGVLAALHMHQIMLLGVMQAPASFFDTTPIGRILARFSKDIDVVDMFLPALFASGFYFAVEVLGTLFVISYSSPIFIAVIIPIGLLYYFIQRFYVETSRQLKRLESISRSPIYSHFGETVTGASAIRAYGQERRFIEESENKVDVNQMSCFPSIIANRWLAVRLEIIGNFIILFAALFSVLGKNMDPGLVGLSVSYALQITQTLNWLVRMTSEVETNIVAVERIKEYAEAPTEAPWEIPNKTPPLTWPENGTVEFKDYSVRYRPGLDLVLKGVSFNIKGGEKVGIVGRTGAGKSSLTLSLFRIIEAAKGEIMIDGINIAGIGLHALRSRLTIIPQDAVLFSGSLRMNLDPFDTHSDDDIWASLEHAHLKTFVKGLPAGLNHEVTEGGENLSVGQRQLICLARALLRKTKVLILDEATAAVDLETDDLIQSTIRTEFKNCTVLTIAHRLNTIMDSDRVIVLDKGEIVEFDSPANLLAKKQSIFHGMCRDAGLA